MLHFIFFQGLSQYFSDVITDVEDKDRIKYIFVKENNETFGYKMSHEVLGSR